MIYKNITRDEYVKLDGINASTLKPYYESALNGNYESSLPRVETPAMRFGTACHSMILEPDDFLESYDVLKLPINEKTGKEYGADTKKAQDYISTLPTDKKYLSINEMETLQNIYNNAAKNETINDILDLCQDREIAVTWKDIESGLQCKALIDFSGVYMAGDLKTTREIKFRNNSDDLSKSLRWDIIGNKNLLQFAFYYDGMIANDMDIENFAVIFAQNNGNCETLAAYLSSDSIKYGRSMYRRALNNYINRDKNESAFLQIIEI